VQIAVPPAELAQVVDDECNDAHNPAGEDQPKASLGRQLDASKVQPD
jgi:hypothetical protein